MYKKVLLAMDRSNESEKAFNRAVSIARDNQAILTIVHALGIPTDYDYKLLAPDDDKRDLAREEAGKMLNTYKEKAFQQGVTAVDLVIKHGMAKRVLTEDVIPSVQPDLVVVGATGMSALDRILIGSVSEYVVRHSPVDVLVVRS
ncbi:universal stress protein [Desulfuribacillus alkaliarsenatis]|nr:universal stress protein [Desulfuribacillus alkaliarsenatis]